MSGTGEFTGLTMPVFTAFGWAGEETAIQFALAQLEQFTEMMHGSLSREGQTELPIWGVDKDAQTAFLASNRTTEEGPYILFNARPMQFEMRLCVTDKAVLNKGFKMAERDPEEWYRIMKKLGPDWSLHLNQLHVDEDTGESSNYQDLFKGEIAALDQDEMSALFSRASFLNSENKWITSFYLINRMPSERVAAMGVDAPKTIADEVEKLLTIITWFTRKTRRPKASKKTKTAKKKTAAASKASMQTTKAEVEGFDYVADLRPLHIRKGFINMTPGHWPFFAENARTVSRPVKVHYADRSDSNCSVWRLQPSEMARLVLSERVHDWLEESFEADTQVNITAAKEEDDKISITLTAVE